ncbi:NYN domain-containing protein [uncultured Clostridium sp.]|uniref:NYN domain-containing protein n=1 Tax=uncultured Clostridium sp. TaxID=59620 RepID=UPI0028ED46BA|nr:NYN domain-containing protein [uncultured Clostridium sp.]
MRNVFVDGYNVINSWPELKLIKDYSLEGARQKLIEMLQNYATFKGYKIFLVFDAHLVVGSSEKKERYGEYLIVVFTKEGETADAYIEKKVNDMGRKWEVCVVTSDSLEQQVTFQRGAIRMSSLEFYHEVKSIERKISSNIENNRNNKRDTIEDRMEGEILEKLLKIRKSH